MFDDEELVRTLQKLVDRRAQRALDDSDFLYAQQVNLETIHRHDVLAERSSTVGELRAELAGQPASAPAELRDWLRSSTPA
jgi:GTP cyclohydrolase-4